MQINEIKELAMLMNSAGLSDIELKIPGMEIKLKKQGAFVQMTSMPAVEETKEQVQIHIESKPEAKVTKALNGKEVKSPIVGTFYSSPSPDSPAYVKVGDTVKKGDVLVRLNSPEIAAKKQQATAALQSALALQSTAERGSQEENVASLYANWQSLKAQQNLATVSYQRGENLFKEGVISRQRRDELYAASQSALEMTEAAYQQYARAKRGSTPQQKSSADAQVDIAQAALNEANALEAETELLAPVNGTVSKTYGKISELVATAVPVVSLIEEKMWLSLNIREDQYAPFQKLESIQGYIPALDQTASFQIKSISAEGEFATIKTTRQTGGYDVRSFKLHLLPTQTIPELKVGMSVLFKLKETP